MPHSAEGPPPSGVSPYLEITPYNVFCTKFPDIEKEDWKDLKKDIHMARQVLQDHPGKVILYFGPWGSPLRTVAQINRSWLRDNFTYCNRKLQDDRVSFLSFPYSRAVDFVKIFTYMSINPPPLSAFIDREQYLYYSALRWSNTFAKEGSEHSDPIALYALAELLEHNGMMMKVIDLLDEFSKTHDALPHESLIERAYKKTRIGSHLRRFLLQLWIEEFDKRKIFGVAYLHLYGCLEDDAHAFDIRYLQGVYRGTKVNVWDRGHAKENAFCHCATCNSDQCVRCKRGVCLDQEMDKAQILSLYPLPLSRNQPRDTWWGEYKPTPNNWELPQE